MDRYRKTLYSIERIVRSLRVDLEAELLGKGSGGVAGSGGPIIVQSGLDTLLSERNPIADMELLPRQEIAHGVSCSYNHERAGTRIRAKCVSFDAEQPDDKPSSCLLLTPEFNPKNMPEWMTLETNLDVAALNRIKSLELRFMPHFRYAAGERLGNFNMNFRVSAPQGGAQTYLDFGHRSFPSLAVPLELTYSISEAQWAEIPLATATEARILLNLPLWSEVDYSMALSFFEVSGPRRN